MAELFGRRARVSIGELAAGNVLDGPSIGGEQVPTALRVSFKVDRDRTAEPNKAEVQVYNLSEDSRAQIKKGDLLTLEAGYVDSIAQIFQGDVRTISHLHNGADWITKLTAGDGENASRTNRVSESFGPKTKVSQVLQKLCDAYGVKIGNASEMIKAKAKIQEYLQGKTIFGLASEQLERILADVGLEYSVQDGALQVCERGKAVNAPAVLLGPESGLVGSPEVGEEGKDGKTIVKMTSLLQPRIIPARLIDLQSESKTGLVRANKVAHEGDTFSGAWYTRIEGSLL